MFSTRPNVIILDNYDSFIHNIVHEIAVLNCDWTLKRNDECSVQEILALEPTHLILGPGPGKPQDAGIMMDLIEHCAGRIPILGICLGHQALGLHFGATVCLAPRVQHGKKSLITHTQKGLFNNLPSSLQVGRYHSLHITDIPHTLQTIAVSEDGCVQAFQHTSLPIHGIQFHPESILSLQTRPIWKQFLLENPCSFSS